MTTEQPEATLPPDPAIAAGDSGAGPAAGATAVGARAIAIRHLRRRTSDRVIGGVAGGLGDYLNVDPILLRVGFAGLMIFGGAGLVLYVLGWLLIPAAGHQDSVVQAAIRGVANRTGRGGLVILVIAAVVVLSPWISDRYSSFYVPAEVFWALAIALIGIVLLLPREQPSTYRGGGASASVGPGATVAGPDSGAGGGVGPADAVAPGWARSAPAKPVREPSPLGWFVLAGVFLVVGALAVVDTVATVRVPPGQYFGAGLLALGIGLVVGAWWGRARLLILLGLAVLPLAALSAFLTVPLEGGFGDHEFRPQNLAEVRSAYNLVGGRLRINLTDLEAGAEPVAIAASVGIGEIVVIVPEDAIVEVTGTVQGGDLLLFGREHIGTGLIDHTADTGGGDGVHLVLTLDVGIGEVLVDRARLEGN